MSDETRLPDPTPEAMAAAKRLDRECPLIDAQPAILVAARIIDEEFAALRRERDELRKAAVIECPHCHAWVIECPHCHAKIHKFDLTGEWTCDWCGAVGEFTYGDDEPEDDPDERT